MKDSQGQEIKFIPPRWISPYNNAVANVNQGATIARVYLSEFEVLINTVANAICFINNAIAGNVIVGIYGPIITEETCAGSPLVVQSASTPVAGANQPQIVTLTDSNLIPGRYYSAVEFSATSAFARVTSNPQIVGWIQSYDLGVFGTLTNPCPAVLGVNIGPMARIRCNAVV